MNPHRTAKANEAALRKVLTQRTLAVSYTHLDVYKRQEQVYEV